MKYRKELDNLFDNVLDDLKDESKFHAVTERRPYVAPNKTRFSAVYILSHFQSGRLYIGSTGDIQQRLYEHVNKLLKSGSDVKQLQSVFDKDNRLKFYVMIVENKQQALDCEQYLLTNHIKSGLLFNQGENAKTPRLGLKNTYEQNIALSKRSSLYWRENPELKKKFVDLMTSNEVVTKRLNTLNIPEIRNKQLTNLREAIRSQENRLRSTTENNRRWSDPEYRKKTKKAIQIANQDPERRAKITEANKQRWADPEYKKRVSEAISRARLAKKLLKNN